MSFPELSTCNKHSAPQYDCPRCWEARPERIAAPYRASPALEAFIVANAPAWLTVPPESAPTTLRLLRSRAAVSHYMFVSAEHSVRTIYSSPQVNYAFRAWHDALHLKLGAEFDAHGELLVARAHERAVRDAIKQGAYGLTELDCCALFFETWGQFRYCEEHGGAFPVDQARFVGACFALGMSAAVLLDF